MMAQWDSCKKAAGDMLLFFRMGDFYEAFHEDASIIAEVLELTLTKRGGVSMCGVPWHTVEPYIDRLVQKGFCVAIAEQVEDIKDANGLLHREIVRRVTPGTLFNVAENKNNYISACAQVGSLFGLASIDVTTGDFRVIEFNNKVELVNEIARISPSEFVLSKKMHLEIGVRTVTLEEWQFDHENASRYLTRHFCVQHLDGFGLRGMVSAINAAGALLAYLHEELSISIAHIQRIVPYSLSETLLLDRNATRHLELTESILDRSRKNTLLDCIDKTSTPMGGRLIVHWLCHPLLSVAKIQERQNAVEELYYRERNALRKELRSIRDLERLMMRVSAHFATPRDVKALQLSLQRIAPLSELLASFSSPLLVQNRERLGDYTPLLDYLNKALAEEPPLRLSEGGVFAQGINAELDELRDITKNGKRWLACYQEKIKEETGIKNLKVHFNKVFGYYIEVSRAQASLMPETFVRRQTLVNAERFISPALKEYEEKVLSSEETIQQIEERLFQELKQRLIEMSSQIFESARAIATLDVILSLAEAAKQGDYYRPVVDETRELIIEGGRHPVVECVIGKESFVANETMLNSEQKLMLITGPNMAGKSTYIRQVALLVILAQMGSFIPASHAQIGIVDKIFTRIGAIDDLSRGQSTFMLEMTETANILHNATSRSLVILDEIGRGTSTYDGVSIAWSVAEYLLKNSEKSAKTLFATHYFELTQLEEMLPGAVNYHAAVEECQEKILFLHKIVRGGADKSYGIHVARLAGLPLEVIKRAQQVLKRLEAKRASKKSEVHEHQLSLF
ncbi:MAG: DNA mismatch repair protein MutS [Chlamydiales bacterium]